MHELHLHNDHIVVQIMQHRWMHQSVAANAAILTRQHMRHACSGQGAALAGGTTMEIDFAVPVDGDIMAGYKMYREKAAKSVMDYGFHMAITTWNDKVPAVAPATFLPCMRGGSAVTASRLQ